MNGQQGDTDRLAAEARARVIIDRQLADAGWSVQDKKNLNLFAAQGVACREVVMKPGHGRTDYLLYVDQRAVGAIEARALVPPLHAGDGGQERIDRVLEQRHAALEQ